MIRASSFLFWFTLTIVASVALYHTSYRVHQLRLELNETNASIGAEQSDLHVLRAEWAYLSSPARIAQETKGHLDLRPTAVKQVATLAQIDDLMPLRDAPVAAATPAHSTRMVAVHGNAPLATVASSEAVPLAAIAALRRKLAVADNSHINNRMIMEHGNGPSDGAHLLFASYGSRP